MSDYPDPDEEFELMYGNELELLREQDYEELPTKSTNEPVTETPTNIEHETETQMSQDLFPSHAYNKKRSIQELFGDIDDILLADEVITKKSKSESDAALIDHIIHLRKLAKEQNALTTRRDHTKCNSERDKHNLSYRVPTYPFIGVTRHDKKKVYVRFHSEEFEKDEMERIVKDCGFEGVMGDSFKDVWKDAQELINKALDMETTQDETPIPNRPPPPHDNKQLWVDLYKPKRYLELLSDESTNRIMLRWLKLWDKVVFNRSPKLKPANVSDSTNKPRYFKQELNTDLDEHGRPYHKVALLCGAPGLGKTTLAHMVAKHAGYNIVEINASDDRSTEAFKTSLENATQMRSVVDQQKRPNCLIFDEIDGAPHSSIEYLVKFINGTATSKAKKGSKKQQQSLLKRPIICICNDVYVPALRPLRQIAFVVNFPQTSSVRLAERLMEISRRQHIKTDMGAMTALAEKSHNDIRSCLSVLHFFKMQSKPVYLSDIYRASIGQKDMQKGLFTVWQEIFTVERSKLKDTTTKTRMGKILQTVTAFGDYDRLAQGVFENFPILKPKESLVASTCQALDWFCYTDLLNKQIYSLQNYTLTTYLQYAFVVWHFAFASGGWHKLQYPNAGYEARTKQQRNKTLVAEVLRGMHPQIRAYSQTLSLVLDTFPLLLRIIVPSFRPVSLHLYSSEEKEKLLKVVNIMIAYNLNYVQERSAEGNYNYNLEPNIEEIVSFKQENQLRKQLSYLNKQLIAREIDLEKMRRFENTSNENKSEAPWTKSTPPSEGLPNHLQVLKPQVVNRKIAAPTVTKDFFGRIIEKPVPKRGTQSSSKHEQTIWYVYKEGYSNAVRRRLKVSDLK